MMKEVNINHILFIVISIFILSACKTREPIVRNIPVDAYPDALASFTLPGDYQVYVLPVKDSRQEYEKGSRNKTIKFFLPLILWFQGASVTNNYVSETYLSNNVLLEIKELTDKVIKNSNMSDPSSANEYNLEIELIHYYSHNYSKHSSVATYGAAMSNTHTFFPTGYVGLKINLYNAKNDEPAGSKYLTNIHLFNPDIVGTSLGHTAYGRQKADIIDNRSLAATQALKDLAARIPYTVDEIIANANSQSPQLPNIETFMLFRMTEEYDFLEKVVIEYESGLIIENSMEKRYFPIISKPDEWIVAPFQEGGHWMDKETYKDYIALLNLKYHVEFADNLNAANFYGMR